MVSAVPVPLVPVRPSVAALRRALAPLAIDPLHLDGLVLCTVVSCGWLWAAAVPLPPLALFYLILLPLTAYYLGRILLAYAPLPEPLAHSLPLTLLTGILGWSLAMFALHSFLPCSLRVDTLGMLALAVGGQFLLFRREPPPRAEKWAALLDLFVVLFSLLAATCWARGLLHSQQRVGDVIVFRHWRDFFDHSAFLFQLLSHEHVWQFGHKELSGVPAPLYHYGSYFPAAALAAFGRLHSYQVVVAFWTPFGTFLSGLAAYTLGAALGRRRAGVWAAVALLTLPDASWFGLHNGWFRYHWLQQVGAGGMYGCCSAALAVLFLAEARRQRPGAALGYAVACTGATFFFKAQLFVVLVPLVFVWSVLCLPRFSVAWRILLLEALLLLAVAAVLVNNKYHLGPRLAPNLEYFDGYCRYVALESKPTRWSAFVKEGAAAVGRSRFYLAATGLVLAATFGGLLGALPVLTAWAWWTRRLRAADLAPWLAVTVYTLFLVGLDDRFVGICWWELIHRPFVWAWFLVVVWCAGKLAVLVGAVPRLARWTHPGVACAAGVLLLPVAWHLGRNIQYGQTVWSADACNLSVPAGLVDCGRFIASHGPRHDIVQDSQYDGVTMAFCSQCERRSYLSRPDMWRACRHQALKAIVERRFVLTEQLKQANSLEQLRALVRESHIRWYLVHPDDHFPWPAEVLAAPAYQANGFAVYDLSRLSSL